MVNIGTISQGGTARFYYSTAAADGGEENFSATLEEADYIIRKDGSTMTLDTGTITTANVSTGLYEVEIDTSNDADFTAGSEYWVLVAPDTETIDSQNISGVVGVFWIATDIETSLGLMSAIHENYTVGATGNDTTHVHLSGITATMGDDEIIGEVLLLFDVSVSEFHYAVVTDFANSGDLATVETLQGGSLPFTPASGDYYWRTAPGVATALSTAAKADVNSEADSALSDYDPPTKAELDSGFAGLNDLSAAQVNAEVDTALGDYDGPTKAELDSGLAGLNDPTAAAIRSEIDSNSTQLAALVTQRAIPAKNSAFTFNFTMHDSTDGWTLEPGITVTAEVSKEGAAFAAASGSVTEVEEGVYEFAAAAGDMNANYGIFKFTGTGCRPTTVKFVTDGGV